VSYLFDTNICIYIIKKSPEKVLKKLEDIIKKDPEQDFYITSITLSELYYGVEKSSQQEKNLLALKGFLSMFKVLDFNQISAQIYGEVRASLEKKGNLIGPYDLQIASIALANQMILVSNNLKEFDRIKGLKTENWC
jgi:tRNA(fMet)-specific endonuclease VapC